MRRNRRPRAAKQSDQIHADLTTEDCASDNDRRWFEARPDRRYRLRPRLSRELGGAEDITHVLVIQMFPGARVREGVRWLGGALPADRDDQLARLAELIHAGEGAYIVNGRVVGFDELSGGMRQ
jgi:hypothetical protein